MADVDIWQDEAGSFLNEACSDCLASCSPDMQNEEDSSITNLHLFLLLNE